MKVLLGAEFLCFNKNIQKRPCVLLCFGAVCALSVATKRAPAVRRTWRLRMYEPRGAHVRWCVAHFWDRWFLWQDNASNGLWMIVGNGFFWSLGAFFWQKTIFSRPSDSSCCQFGETNPGGRWGPRHRLLPNWSKLLKGLSVQTPLSQSSPNESDAVGVLQYYSWLFLFTKGATLGVSPPAHISQAWWHIPSSSSESFSSFGPKIGYVRTRLRGKAKATAGMHLDLEGVLTFR